MNHYVGIDVSLEASSVCVVDGNGKIIREGKIVSEPDALIAWLIGLKLELTRIGLEAGPLSQWLYAAMRQAGLAVELLETRHVRNALKTMPVKTDRNDARGIAQLMRLGWFRPVHCKSIPAQETRALLTARKLVQVKLHDIEMSLRGILRGFGLRVGPTTPVRFEGRIRELVAGHPSLETIAQGLLAVRVALRREFDRFEKQVLAVARCDTRARLLMSIAAACRLSSWAWISPLAAASVGLRSADGSGVRNCSVTGSGGGATPSRGTMRRSAGATVTAPSAAGPAGVPGAVATGGPC